MNVTTLPAIAPKINDILVSSWGYDQTNVDFYKVVNITSSGKSVTIQRINSSVVETGFMSGKSMPAVPHTFSKYKGEPMIKRVNLNKDVYSVKINSFATAYKWDGNPECVSWYA
jgi:hypothetical protein